GVPVLGAGRDRHPVPAPSAGRQGRRRVRHGRLARRDRQRGGGRAPAVRGPARRHAAHPGERLARRPGAAVPHGPGDPMNGTTEHKTAELRSRRTPYVLATVVRAERPTSAKTGDRALVLPDGTMEGFVGGECAESAVRDQALRLLRSGESTLLRITPEAAY